MKKRLFSFILSLTIITVAATAINCGCAFAEMTASHQKVEQTAMAHCEQQEEASNEAEACCVGCQLELGALNPHNIEYQLQRSSELLPSNLIFTKTFLQVVSKHPIISSQLYEFKAHGVSIPSFEQPIYIVLESFLI